MIDQIFLDMLSPAIYKQLIESFPVHLFHRIIHENKTAVILLGDLRGGELTWNTLYKHVLDINNADLILVPVGEIPQHKQSSSLLKRAKFTFYIPHFDDWAEVMDIISKGNTRYRRILPGIIDNTSILLGGSSLGTAKGSGALIFSVRWILREFLRENQFHIMYDRFVLTRSDQYYVCEHDLSRLLPVSKIFIPKGEDYRGICDRHIVCSSKDVMAVLNVLPPLIENPEKYKRYTSLQLSNTESFLNIRLEEMGLLERVDRFRRMMFIASVAGDNYTWEPPITKNISEGVSFKYQFEYLSAKYECFRLLKYHGGQDFSPPIGMASWNGVVLQGWACDRDNPLESTYVKAYISNVTFNSDSFQMIFKTDKQSGIDVRTQCNGGIYHRFSKLIPSNVSKTNHSVMTVYAIDLMDPRVEVEILKTNFTLP
jgi:hypothetical protein